MIQLLPTLLTYNIVSSHCMKLVRDDMRTYPRGAAADMSRVNHMCPYMFRGYEILQSTAEWFLHLTPLPPSPKKPELAIDAQKVRSVRSPALFYLRVQARISAVTRPYTTYIPRLYMNTYDHANIFYLISISFLEES